MLLIWLVSIICLGLAAFGFARWAKRRRRRKRKAVASDHDEFEQLVGMTSTQERNFVRQYAARDFKGEGAIVELGCWLGSFTVPLAIGLRENPRISGRPVCIHAYDLFTWQDWMNPCVAGTRWAGRYKEGEDFREAFAEQIALVADRVAIHPGDLNRETWESSAPIEYLLIDAMKSWDLSNSVVRNFFPALKPGLSVVHHQDFAHFFTPWIHLLMYRFRRYFEPLTYVPNDSYVFAYREQIPAALLGKRYSFEDFPEDEAAAAFEYSLSLIPATARANVFAARVMMHIHCQDWTGARTELDRIRVAGIPLEKELLVVSKLLQNHLA